MTTPFDRFEADDESFERDLFARRARALTEDAPADLPSLADVLRAAETRSPIRRLPVAATAIAMAAAVLLGITFVQMNKAHLVTIAPDPAATSAPAVSLPGHDALDAEASTCAAPVSTDESSCQSSCGEEPSATP